MGYGEKAERPKFEIPATGSLEATVREMITPLTGEGRKNSKGPYWMITVNVSGEESDRIFFLTPKMRQDLKHIRSGGTYQFYRKDTGERSDRGAAIFRYHADETGSEKKTPDAGGGRPAVLASGGDNLPLSASLRRLMQGPAGSPADGVYEEFLEAASGAYTSAMGKEHPLSGPIAVNIANAMAQAWLQMGCPQTPREKAREELLARAGAKTERAPVEPPVEYDETPF